MANGYSSKLEPMWGENRGQHRQLADLIEEVVDGLRTHEENGRRKIGAFVTRHTLLSRGHRLTPSQFQADLYEWIKKRGFVPRQFTLGMNWTMLGGLMCRGLIEEVVENGVPGLRAVRGYSTGERRLAMAARRMGRR